MRQSTLLRPRPNLASIAASLTRRPRRSLVLSAIGIIAGALVAALGLFRPAAPAILDVPEGYVALVNERPILMSDFIAQTEAEAEVSFAQSTAAQRRQVLHEMIDEELLVQRGLVLDMPENSVEVRQAIRDAVNAQVDAPVLAATISDDTLKQFYTQHRTDYATDGTMRLHDIVLHIGGFENADQNTGQAEADAEEAAFDLRSGATLAYVMQHFGFVDSQRVDTGDELDFAAKLHLGPTLYKAAAALGTGDISDPVLDSDGVHLLIMEERRQPHYADFESARAKVYAARRTVQTTRAEQNNLQLLRSSSQILLAPGQGE